MRFFLTIVVLGVAVLSCKTQKIETVNIEPVDSEQFTYLYSEALKNKMLGQTRLAVNQFMQCLEMFPESTASSYQLSLLAFDDSDFIQAKSYIDFCLKYKPDNEWYLLQRALIARKLNETDISVNIYSDLVKLFPDNINYSYELAIIQFENKNYDESLYLLKKIEESVGINENISFLRNNIYFELKRMDAIQLELLKLRKAFPDSVKYSDMLAELYLNFSQTEKALDVYQSMLDKDPENSQANIGIAWIYGSSGNCLKGYPFFLKAFESGSIDNSRKIKVGELYISNKCDLSVDSLDFVYHCLIDSMPFNSEIYNSYISFLYDLKDYKTAEVYANQAVSKNPDSFRSWELLFNILLVQNKNEDLKNSALKAMEYFPNHALVFFYAGYSHFLLKKYNEAINFLEIGIDYASENTDLQKQFLIYLAESYHSNGKNKQSDNYFDKYLAIDPNNAYVLNNYAYYLANRNEELERALSYSRKSIEVEPFNSSFLDTYSFILYCLKDYDMALNYIERSYKYGGNSNPAVVEHYGDILYKKSKVDEALERWKEAYSLNRNNKKLLEKINQAELEN